MLPRLDAFVAGLRLFIRRRHDKPATLDEAALAEALVHAAELAAGAAQDEPAALFFACARRSRAFGPASHELLPILARNQAHGLGHRLDLTDIALAILHARVVLGDVPFEEVRGTFTAALRPADRPPPPAPPRRG